MERMRPSNPREGRQAGRRAERHARAARPCRFAATPTDALVFVDAPPPSRRNVDGVDPTFALAEERSPRAGGVSERVIWGGGAVMDARAGRRRCAARGSRARAQSRKKDTEIPTPVRNCIFRVESESGEETQIESSVRVETVEYSEYLITKIANTSKKLIFKGIHILFEILNISQILNFKFDPRKGSNVSKQAIVR